MINVNTVFLNREIPNVARIVDYLAGGTAHYAVDRKTARDMMAVLPSLKKWVRLHRAFIHEATQQLHKEGFRQFLDLASSIPTNDYIHAFLPESRVVYSNPNPVASSYGHSLFASHGNVTFIQADARNLAQLVSHPNARHLLNDDEATAIGLNGLLIFLEPDECKRLLTDLYSWAPAGSRLFAVLHCRAADAKTDTYTQIQQLSSEAGVSVRLHTLDTNKSLLYPWQFVTLESITDYLGLPSDFILPGDRAEIELAFYAAILEKPTAVSD